LEEKRVSDKSKLIVVTGAGGFIGGSLVAAMRARGCTSIRAVDMKPLGTWYQEFDDVQNLSLDLNLIENCQTAHPNTTGLDEEQCKKYDHASFTSAGSLGR
jgi:nucleoside-diphosphate-sugar epimerase